MQDFSESEGRLLVTDIGKVQDYRGGGWVCKWEYFLCRIKKKDIKRVRFVKVAYRSREKN